MEDLLFSVSGLRGVVGSGLNPKTSLLYTVAFARWNGRGVYVVGRDTRPHGIIFVKLVISTLRMMGNDVVDVGIVPTPTLLFLVRKWNAQGGIIVTASHNPIEWNALKFVKKGGVFPTESEKCEIEKFVGDEVEWVSWSDTGSESIDENAWLQHVDAVLSWPGLDTEKIRAKGLTAVVDAVNGAAYKALPHLLEKLGLKVIRLNCNPDSPFPHTPEPRRENLREIDVLLREEIADVGFAVDPDADRLVIGIRGMGILSEEYTFPLAAWSVLRKKKGDLVVNYSSSLLSERVAEKFGVRVFRSKVGEANVVEKMRDVGALIGGEGNGGVIFPEINTARDSLVGAALILDLLAEKGLDVVKELPEYCLVKKRFERRKGFDAEALAGNVKEGEIDLTDGVYIRFENSWLHIRPSNTEPIIRVYAEAENPTAAEDLIKYAEVLLKKADLI